MPDSKAPWGALEDNDKLSLHAMMLDVALIKQSNDEQTRKLDRIESSLTMIPVLAADVADLKSRAETIEKNVKALDNHELRIQGLEKDLIKNGELRLSNIEKLRSRIFTSLGGALLSGAGYVLITYVLPALKH